jgi:hypothetical protein
MNFESLQAFALQSPMLSLALVGLTVAIIYTEISRFFTGYKTVNSAGLTALINREDAQVFDVSAIREQAACQGKRAADRAGLPHWHAIGRGGQETGEGRFCKSVLARWRRCRLATGRLAAGKRQKLTVSRLPLFGRTTAPCDNASFIKINYLE